MEKRLREISRFFVAPRHEFAPAVRARPRTPFSINTSTSVVPAVVPLRASGRCIFAPKPDSSQPLTQ